MFFQRDTEVSPCGFDKRLSLLAQCNISVTVLHWVICCVGVIGVVQLEPAVFWTCSGNPPFLQFAFSVRPLGKL